MDQNPQQIESNDILTETWFLALLGSMITVMTLLFIGMFLVRKHHLLSKKSALPNLYGIFYFFLITLLLLFSVYLNKILYIYRSENDWNEFGNTAKFEKYGRTTAYVNRILQSK